MPKISYKFLDQKNFAALAGVAQQNISKALKKGRLVWELTPDGKRDGINPNNPLNAAYINLHKGSNSGNRREVKAGKEAAKMRKEEGGLEAILNKIETLVGKGQFEPGGEASPESFSASTRKEVAARAVSQEHAALDKQVSAAIKQITLAEKMGELIRRQDVMDWWKRITGAMHNNILSMDERIADEIAAICGATDPDIVAKVRRRIGDESVSAMTQVKNEAEKFASEFGMV